MMLDVLDIKEVVQRQLCCGCGACAGLDPGGIEMIDTLEHGRRPRHRTEVDGVQRPPLPRSICPGIGLERNEAPDRSAIINELHDNWGPVLELWEGHAADPAIRLAGSSGGAATALALSCLEEGGMHGVLHIRSRPDAPILNESTLSTTRGELLEATGSRYAPASPCDLLHQVASAPAPCVMIGKPCDVAAANNAARVSPALAEKLGVTIAVVCGGTPTTRATRTLLSHLGIDDPRDVMEIRYRGNGWPGDTVVRFRTKTGEQIRRLTYEQAWGEILARDKQWRCHVCADHSGEFADISVGDPWHRTPQPGEPGRSLVIVRTERGRKTVRRAVETGYLVLQRVDPRTLPASQPNLLKTQAAVWGRTLACRLAGAAAPRYRGLPIFRRWWGTLTLGGKLRSLAGTIRRIRSRNLNRRIQVTPLLSGPSAIISFESQLHGERILQGTFDGSPCASRTRPVARSAA